jgi:putative spermidine/putrescine transport system permease protein
MKKVSAALFEIATLGLSIAVVVLYAAPLLLWLVSLLHHASKIHAGAVGLLYLSVIGPTIGFSVAAAASAVIGGTALSCLAVSGSQRQRVWITGFMTIPLLMGFIARNYAWVGLLSQFAGSSNVPVVSWLAHALLYKGLGVVVVMGTVFTPFCYFIILQGFGALSIEPLQAARTMGATDRAIFWSVILPSIRSAQTIAFLLSTILGVGYFITPELIGGGNTQFIGNDVLVLLNETGLTFDASLLAFLLLATVLVLLVTIRIVVRRMQNRRHRAQPPRVVLPITMMQPGLGDSHGTPTQ